MRQGLRICSPSRIDWTTTDKELAHMSTRAVYTFIQDGEAHHVYKHHDGYPSGAADAIANALPLAWPLPRFEADEFAAAFVAGNKERALPALPMSQGGGIRLTHGWDRHGDLEYRYEITGNGNSLRIVAYSATYVGDETRWEKIFDGGLSAMRDWAKTSEA